MNNVLSKRITLWSIFITYILYTYFTWEIYEGNNIEPPTSIYLMSLILLAVFLLVSAYRCGALGWSGWRVLAIFIPIVGFFLLIFLLFKKPIDKVDVPNSSASS